MEEVKTDKGQYFFTQDLLEPFRKQVKKGLEKFMGNSSTNGQSEDKERCAANMPHPAAVGVASGLQEVATHTCCPCIVSAVGDVVRQAVGLTHLGHFYVQTGVFSDLSSIPAPRSSWEHSVLMLQTRAACTLWWGCSTSAGCATSATQ